jgi:hypothetical protein
MTPRDRAGRAEQELMAAWHEILEAIAAVPDPVQAFQLAERLSAWAEGVNGAGSVSATVKTLKAAQVKRVWESRKLSLAALGDVLGMSKTRADQMLRSAQGRRVSK